MQGKCFKWRRQLPRRQNKNKQQKQSGKAVIKIRVMLRGLCSASSIFPVVYLIKATTTTRKMEDPELKLFRMTPVLCNNKKRIATRLGFPTLRAATLGNDGMKNKNPPFVQAAVQRPTKGGAQRFFYPLLNEMTPDTVLILNRRVNNQQRRLCTVAQIQQLLVKCIALVKGVYLIVQMA